MRFRLPTPAFVIACLALVIALGGTSFAAVTATGSAVNIVDPVAAANKARVDASGKLQVAVNGTAGARPVAPSTPWATDAQLMTGTAALLEGPRSAPINVTSLTLSLLRTAADTDKAFVALSASHVPASATTCSGAVPDGSLWEIARLTASAPFTVSFPTPLQLVPPAGTRGCLFVSVVSDSNVDVNASGFVS
jgi:hypothetical protein